MDAAPEKCKDKSGEEVELVFTRPRLFTIDGVPLAPHNFCVKYWKQTREYLPRDDDIFIVTYPKSGTTWLQEIFFSLFNGRQPKDIKERAIHCPFLEFSGTDLCNTMYRPGALKIHMRFEHSPYAANAKYIYCVRNPKDCCVSFYFHSLTTLENFKDCSFEEYFEYFMEGRLEFGNYWQHLESWYPNIGNGNVLFLTYEDMKEDILRELAKIGDFIGGEWGMKLKGEKAKEVAELSSFKNMKSLFTAGGDGDFVRKGIVHDWKNHLTDEMSQRIERETYARLKDVCPDLLKQWEDLGVLSGSGEN
ncbi:estrogen sulfotransferase, testis isoform [Galendromus occidentalis]|uniref:Estrogen sulfotransferase, testis isoform n=1 Tax=Galendromus occidentalis TaxID=34638 RepID=A0AAJ6W0I2_9ACAR|nr:estrogen sulfotransferase, testis isoform [Galendromus occidentalis]